MDAMKMAGFAIASALLLLMLRQIKPEAGFACAVCAGALLLLMLLPGLKQIMEGVVSLSQQSGVKPVYLSRLLKITGVSLLMDFAAQTCRDAGEQGLAMKTELAGRVMILTLALPAMQTLLRQILSLAP